MLDVSVRAGILNLLREVARRPRPRPPSTSRHDLALVRYVCERTLVMYLGRVVEDGPTEEIGGGPAHPYTRRWSQPCRCPMPTSARPAADQRQHGRCARAAFGCRFRDRCPHACRAAPRDAAAAHVPAVTGLPAISTLPRQGALDQGPRGVGGRMRSMAAIQISQASLDRQAVAVSRAGPQLSKSVRASRRDHHTACARLRIRVEKFRPVHQLQPVRRSHRACARMRIRQLFRFVLMAVAARAITAAIASQIRRARLDLGS